jgi:hypothetical protein
MEARKFMQNYVSKYVDENYDKLAVTHHRYLVHDAQAKADHLKMLKNDKFELDWFLGEILDRTDFVELGIIIFNDWIKVGEDEFHHHETIYKIDDKLIRGTFLQYLDKPATYEHVKQVATTVIVYSYEPDTKLNKQSKSIK